MLEDTGSPDGANRAVEAPGCFVAVVGPSGAGKDTLLQLAFERLQNEPRFVLARRSITRASRASDEDHETITAAEFASARAKGRFCLSWEAHGLGYGLPAALCRDVDVGRIVVANLSRRVLYEAAERFAHLVVVEITAPRDILVERIAARGREPREAITARVNRSVVLKVPEAAAHHRIVNDATAQEGADRLLCVLRAIPAR